MKFVTNICRGTGAVALAGFAAMPAWAQTAAAAAPTVDKGDTAWMMTSTVLVLMMILPGLALFYGGLTRSKNMLSTMTQIGTVTAICMIIWVGWGYSEAFGDGGNAVIASFSKVLLHGVNSTTTAATFTDGRRNPRICVCLFSDDLRCDHRGAGAGKRGRANEVLRHRDLFDHLADDRLFPDRAHGVGRRWILLRAWERSISPAEPLSTSTRAFRRWLRA